MTGYVVTKNVLCSISVMYPTEWDRERSFVALIFMKLTTLLHFQHLSGSTGYFQLSYPSGP